MADLSSPGNPTALVVVAAASLPSHLVVIPSSSSDSSPSSPSTRSSRLTSKRLSIIFFFPQNTRSGLSLAFDCLVCCSPYHWHLSPRGLSCAAHLASPLLPSVPASVISLRQARPSFPIKPHLRLDTLGRERRTATSIFDHRCSEEEASRA
ncbi:hypothetical protein EDD37DRAFT_350744 [Exophiala viscosa]|uniref:uncharacterized protein n=1 Tax=Exophiala viscosa TaxID=2486360 RepID=UPI002192299B|nr:hypothetical protein EDD37DRAFT_350744 [Exophiala viscosa]